MYLGSVNIRMADGSIRTVGNNDVALIGDLVLKQGGVPMRPDGIPFSVTKAFGGELWDGCPIPVAAEETSGHMQNTWAPSQVDVMKAAGMFPSCLVAGSPNYAAFFGSEQVVPNSGTGIRQGGTVITVQEGTPALLPTGVATPSIVPQPGGGAYYVPAEPEEPIEHAGVMATEEGSSWWPWLLAALFVLPKLAGGGYVAHRYYKRRKAAR